MSIRGAREHNLKNISFDLPRNKITVISGLSGSGKSSLAFDTIYAEGQRRYVESLSSYARQFLEQLKKPDVDSISGLSPAISIEQQTTSTNPRSTVGTVTEIYDFLRLLFARVGEARCYSCKKPISAQSLDQMVDRILELQDDTKIHILSPVIRGKKGDYGAEFKKWIKRGFVRAKIDGETVELAQAKKLEKQKTHDIDLFIDRLIVKKNIRLRLCEALESALHLSEGLVKIEVLNNQNESFLLSSKSACVDCGISYPEIEPRFFSFNNPRGACKTCLGLGYIDIDGITTSDDDEVPQIKQYPPCSTCNGQRLRIEALNVFIGNKNIVELSKLPAIELLNFFEDLHFSKRHQEIAPKVVKELVARLGFLTKVGVDYLSMDRPSKTLSGGEAQRIKLASQIGSSLIGVLYVLDEPSIGLHPRDHSRLLKTIRDLCDLGNSILMVEHDEETLLFADYILDLGPGAGKHGGTLLAQGSPDEIKKNTKSITGQYLSKKKNISTPKNRRQGSGKFLEVLGARGNNLKNVNLKLPLGTFITITGVSGSGKSTLIIDTLYRALSEKLYHSSITPAPYDQLLGAESLDKIIDIDQSPIGRTPRSNPATYTGLFTLIRDLYSGLPDSKMRGYKPGRYSFNVKGGRCENCEGAGLSKIEMHFMADVFVQCDVCLGRRYNRETLEIKFKTKSIADVLDMSVEEAFSFFENIPLIKSKLKTLIDVGLGYIHLGQSSTTLSGGEAQRVKLSRELSKRSTGKSFYILDEPTTGLHFEDIRKLIEILQILVDQGNTVLVIEHNLDVVKNSDFVVDLGPEGGNKGGYIVAQGTPESISNNNKSFTGQYLSKIL
ncbi:MAG: excinuclease ABC subunit UvrA [Oligoflexia bacterium]|nr:excinuclease ABC subunit UvrA [Oligoflexia bacterium]